MDNKNPQEKKERELIIKRGLAFASMSGEKHELKGKAKELSDKYILGEISYEEMGEKILEFYKNVEAK